MDHPPPRPGVFSAGGSSSGLSTRAERFEDEKRRIIESCFSKKDPVDNTLLETYITHIRILEFSTHPTSPPPPETRTPQTEKPRVIIVAVRKSGRVRMHKSKENTNGTFSIGKTWDLNDMTGIESFTDSKCDPQERSWAGDVGFTVSLGKPYYWQAQTDKEKKFFIASLIKIYGKYTGGGVPELKGFDPKESDQVLGARRAQPPSEASQAQRATPPIQQTDSRPPSRPEALSGPGPRPKMPQPPSLGGPPAGSDIRPYRPSPPPLRNLAPPNGSATDLSLDSGSRSGSRPPPDLRRVAASNKSQDSVAASTSSIARSEDTTSLPPRSRGGMPGPGAFGRLGDQANPQGPGQLDLPDRRRPPMDPARSQGHPDSDLVPAPLMSPGVRRELREPPPRSTERMRQNSVGQRSDTSSIRDRLPPAGPPPSSPVPPTPDIPKSPTPNQSAEPAPLTISKPSTERPQTPPMPDPSEPQLDGSTPDTPAEDARPGLGPMIKSKVSKVDIAGSMWKAASAVTAFKPRVGGAAERLRKAAELAQASEDEPDGITGVVPAPSRAAATPEPVRPETPKEQPAAKRSSNAVPEVKITVPNASRPSSIQVSSKETTQAGTLEVQTKEDRHRRVAAGNDAKYFTTLGVDTSLLAEGTFEFAKWLDHFGWIPGSQMRNRSFDDMKVDIDREIGKAQAGGWVARFEYDDDRVDVIKTGLDVAIAECEELDNLLTLYSVELSVSALLHHDKNGLC